MAEMKKGSDLPRPIPQLSLAELIAQTPGAQTRQEALAHVRARTQTAKPPSQQPLLDDDIIKAEPMPIIDKPDVYAADFFQRLKMKEKGKQKPPKRQKPRLVIDNDTP